MGIGIAGGAAGRGASVSAAVAGGSDPGVHDFQCWARKWSTIRVGGRIYSVPSRLIGHTVEVRQHPSTVEVLYGGRMLCTMPRLRGAEHRIDYRHIVRSLVPKPGAFARYRFREELFLSLVFRAAYDALGRTHGERADVEYVRLLHLAATTGERLVETTLRARLEAGDSCDYADVQAQVRPPVPWPPTGRSTCRCSPRSGATRRCRRAPSCTRRPRRRRRPTRPSGRRT